MPSRRERESQRKAQKRKQQMINYAVIGVAVIAVIVVVVVLVVSGSNKAAQPTPTTAATPRVLIDPPAIPAAIQRSGTTIGDPNAPVKITEFADFQCPACSYFVQNIKPQLIDQYVATGKASLTFSPYTFIGAESFAAAESALCASDQNKFWEYYDYLYYNQGAVENGGTFSSAFLSQVAEKVGLDNTAFNDCVSSGKYKQIVKDANSIPQSYGLDSTPSFLVNGKNAGKQSELLAAVEAALTNP